MPTVTRPPSQRPSITFGRRRDTRGRCRALVPRRFAGRRRGVRGRRSVRHQRAGDALAGARVDDGGRRRRQRATSDVTAITLSRLPGRRCPKRRQGRPAAVIRAAGNQFGAVYGEEPAVFPERRGPETTRGGHQSDLTGFSVQRCGEDVLGYLVQPGPGHGQPGGQAACAAGVSSHGSSVSRAESALRNARRGRIADFSPG